MAEIRISSNQLLSLRLYHFQAYIDETINFDPVSNAIIGKTDAGKSTITRALYWNLYNKPARVGNKDHDEFTTWGSDNCFVTSNWSNGNSITRGRRKGENYYRIDYADGRKEEFKGFGFEVPPAVLKAHEMSLFDVDDKTSYSLNVSQQLDPIFLFDDGAGKRAKVLGKISGADRTDGAMGILLGWKRGTEEEKKNIITRLQEINEKLNKLSGIEELNGYISTLNEHILQISNTEETLDKLNATLALIVELNSEHDKILNFIAYERELITLTELGNNLQQCADVRDLLESTYSKYTELSDTVDILQDIITYESDLNAVESYLVKLQDIFASYEAINKSLWMYEKSKNDLDTLISLINKSKSLDEVTAYLEKLDSIVLEYERLTSLYSNYCTLNARYSKGLEYISNLEAKYAELELKYQEYIGEFDVCPVCGSEICNEHLNN